MQGETRASSHPSAPPPPPGVLHQHALLCVVRRPFFVRTQAGGLVVMAARVGAAGVTSSARRRRELSVAAALTSARHDSAGPWSGDEARGAARGRGARGERRFTEPDDTSPGGAAGCPVGPQAAVGRGSRGRLRGCRRAPPGCAIVGRFLGRGHRWQHPLLPPTARPGSQEVEGGGCEGGGGAA